MTKFEDNISPYLSFVEGSAPSSPAATNFRLFYDSADHLLKWKNSAGTVVAIATGSAMTNPMSAVGDMIQGTTAGAPAALAAPLAGKVLTGAGVTTPLVYAYPPGHEFDYAQFTSPVTVTATTEATADTLVTGASVAYDGSTVVMVEWSFPYWEQQGAASMIPCLYDGSSSIGFLGILTGLTGTLRVPASGKRRLTPSNASHTYSLRAFHDGGTSIVGAGAGGAAAHVPGFIRITKV